MIFGSGVVKAEHPIKQFFSHVETKPPLPPGYYQYFSGSKCVFAQGHNTAEVRIEPRILAPESEALPPGHRAPRIIMNCLVSSVLDSIRITSLCNVHPLTPHFYKVKLGFTGVYIIFLFLP